jgi:hypothetical protein
VNIVTTAELTRPDGRISARDAELARQHDWALRDTIRLAALLGVSRVVAPFVPAVTGVPEAARLLRAAIDDAALERA